MWDETESFANGFAKVSSEHKWGFVNKLGHPVITPTYESVRNFVNHLAAVKQNSKWGFVNEKGVTVIPFEYDIVFDFTEKVTAVYKNNKWALIDKKGVVTKSLDIDVFRGFKNGSAKITKQGRSGIMNVNGDIISIEPATKSVSQNSAPTNLRPAAAQALACPDNIGFEYGNFTNWSNYIGDVVANGTTNVITVNPSAPTPNRHVIYAATNPSALDPYGLFPINPPDGSGFALKLGNDVNGAEAESVRYTINVPANAVDFSITYRYAGVFQDPGHERYEQPRFSAKILDVAENKYLNCASWVFISDDTIPGFYSSPIDNDIKCKAWTPVFINLSAYAGKTLILEFTTADCTKGAHWGYTYVDVGDCNIAAGIQYQCNPNRAFMTGPPGFRIYKWWNSDYTAVLQAGQNVVLNPAPPLNTTVHLEVIPFNGPTCSDTLHVAVTNNTPTVNAGRDTAICIGASVRIGGSSAGGTTYSWFPANYLSNPNVAMPLSTPPVTTTYIVTATNLANGCTAQDTVTITVNAVPTALFEPDPDQCLTDNSFTFTNTSLLGSTYNWTFGDGESSSETSPVHSYLSARSYTVKLVTTAVGGCMDSTTRTVTVHGNPTVTANNDLTLCRDKSAQLRATGAQLYEWTPAQGLSCDDCPNPIATPLTDAVYYVKGINSFGCPGYDTVAVTVYQPIQITASPDAVICAKESVNLVCQRSGFLCLVSRDRFKQRYHCQPRSYAFCYHPVSGYWF